jgi:Uma2 family endonuclease
LQAPDGIAASSLRSRERARRSHANFAPVALSHPVGHMSYAEYLALEQRTGTRHEYLRGEAFAMAGGTIEHGALAVAISTALSNALRDRPCRVLSSDVKVTIEATGLTTYPDVSVVCGSVQVSAQDPNAVTNPVLVVEVLSDSTEAYDRGEKAAHYRRIPSLREIVLVSQKSPLIEVHRKNSKGNWELVSEAGSGERAELESVGAVLDVSDIYRNPLAS